MVLYVSPVRGGKAEKTNWVMHQYHLGMGEDEREGEYVISKVFYQQQQVKQIEKSEDIPEGIETVIPKADPVTPKSVTPEPPRAEKRFSNYELGQDSTLPIVEHHNESLMRDELETPSEHSSDQNLNIVENPADQVGDKNDDEAAEDSKWWENESQFLLSSQQLVEGLSICDELLQSQSPNRDESGNGQGSNRKPLLSDYARLGPEDLKRDLEECQNFVSDPANIELDTPPDFRLSQLEFESQDSYIAWGGSVRGGKTID
ncbi:hypothetical protein CDL12_29108 [Handroanthus impetiginosus]|uniref:NAC domain-containing protein n=1 Tax=Handroanthus impetiginosus TaxID=429701 RepID=A0A2G9FZD7_9LAMI|nr:hypothetical protein CDL12_29108 [Handroanthus impetiginosus]